MGITGLLPVLKPIQKQKHLSEFAGQTLAVDAYVWLHRGAYACAVELATNKPTKRYVDYCMHRVRLLRHYKIQPFIVFDGGPLPAKQGTEKEREKKREENLAKANALAAQGKQNQARDYYVKCVDVTPQMAYQVIKALRAENVPYVVAPYEADAQMAYLERLGFVDGIVTEDSDLLVFGCKNVLFKLDAVAATIISISRSDFGSPSLASESLSFIGWSDDQFRWMAMMSGCDYLPSIAGIGLKTAHTLLRKYKSVEKALRAIRLEGKKDIPRDYLDAFKLAEKVFLHQRVYDPSQEKLVYLTNPSDDQSLTDEAELYVGRDLDPSLAKRVAEGDACPIDLIDMEDINPNFKPRVIGTLPLQRRDLNTPVCNKMKAKATATPSKGGILNFFTPAGKSSSSTFKAKPIIAPKSEPKAVVAGKGSGKRTLVEVMEEDLALKRKRATAQSERAELASSRFFNQHTQQSPSASSINGRRQAASECSGKENEPIVVDCDDERAIQEDTVIDLVEQEEGYLSPSPSQSGNVTPELSSPVHPRFHVYAAGAGKDALQTSDALSSPVHTRVLFSPRRFGLLTQNIPTQDLDGSAEEQGVRVLVRGSSEPPECEDNERKVLFGPDLCMNFNDDDVDKQSACSEISAWEEDEDKNSAELTHSPSASLTPPAPTQIAHRRPHSYEDILLGEEEMENAKKVSSEKVALGWRQRFAYGNSSTPVLHITPKRKLPQSKSFSTSTSQKRRLSPQEPPRSTFKSRKSDPLPQTHMRKGVKRTAPEVILLSDDIVEEIVQDGRHKLSSFRFSR